MQCVLQERRWWTLVLRTTADVITTVDTHRPDPSAPVITDSVSCLTRDRVKVGIGGALYVRRVNVHLLTMAGRGWLTKRIGC